MGSVLEGLARKLPERLGADFAAYTVKSKSLLEG